MKSLVILQIIIILLIQTISCAQNTDTLPDARGYMVRLGDMAPDFKIEFTDGRPSVKLSELKGNVVMLQFMASWCGVCVKEMPQIEKQIWNEFKDNGLKLFGIDRKENKEAVIKFARKVGVTYPLVMDEKGEIFALYAHPNAGVTRNVLIDKTGKIVFMTRLYDEKEFAELIGKIKEIL